MERQTNEWKSREDLYNTPTNRRLKYIALGVMIIPIAIFIVQMIWYDVIPKNTNLFMRGCAGLFAIVFAIIVGILVYRVEHAFIKQK